MNQYRVVYVEPGKPAVEKEIGTKLEDLQAEVGGLIECIYCHHNHTNNNLGAHDYRCLI